MMDSVIQIALKHHRGEYISGVDVFGGTQIPDLDSLVQALGDELCREQRSTKDVWSCYSHTLLEYFSLKSTQQKQHLFLRENKQNIMFLCDGEVLLG